MGSTNNPITFPSPVGQDEGLRIDTCLYIPPVAGPVARPVAGCHRLLMSVYMSPQSPSPSLFPSTDPLTNTLFPPTHTVHAPPHYLALSIQPVQVPETHIAMYTLYFWLVVMTPLFSSCLALRDRKTHKQVSQLSLWLLARSSLVPAGPTRP